MEISTKEQTAKQRDLNSSGSEDEADSCQTDCFKDEPACCSIEILQAIDYLKLYNDIAELMKGQLSKRCYAVEKSWFDAYQKFGRSLQSMET